MSAVAVALAGCVAVLALDTLGSLAATRFGFPYARLTFLSFAIYAATGYLAAAAGGHFMAGAAAAAAAGAVDATVGWRISTSLGASTEVGQRVESTTAATVTLTAAAVGALAGLLA